MKNKKSSPLVPSLRFPEFREAGEWVEKKLGEIAAIRSGSTPLRANPEFFKDGNIPWVKTTDLNNSFIYKTEEYLTSKTNAKINPEESVLVAMYGGFNQIGRTGFLKIPAATNQAISVLNTDRKKVLPIYLLTWLNAKVENWKKIASSSRKDPNITGSDVASFLIVYPKLEEQQKIAACLSSLDELITAHSQKLDALKKHKKGLMQQLFPAEGQTVPSLRFPEFREAGEWVEKSLKNICQMKAGKFVSMSEIKEKSGQDLYPCFGGNGLRGFTRTYTHDGIYPLIGRQGALCGNINITTGKFHATEHAVVTTPNNDIDVKWLFYELILYQNYVRYKNKLSSNI
ncbi:restriction endonuclease subunit S [Thioflexithrix psekupsensis]|uniref:restriction endonuclease subunit S n=1 Tax=Thioflexithrix psekupsensis TaxID=1570016 RepID=UPI000A38717A|nr:restriction endonuclease subunit S [Thioflexithrix psekupsensis]